MGMKTFCRFPMVTGDWVVLASGDDACPVGDENVHGVADRELLSDIKHFTYSSAPVCKSHKLILR